MRKYKVDIPMWMDDTDIAVSDMDIAELFEGVIPSEAEIVEWVVKRELGKVFVWADSPLDGEYVCEESYVIVYERRGGYLKEEEFQSEFEAREAFNRSKERISKGTSITLFKFESVNDYTELDYFENEGEL